MLEVHQCTCALNPDAPYRGRHAAVCLTHLSRGKSLDLWLWREPGLFSFKPYMFWSRFLLFARWNKSKHWLLHPKTNIFDFKQDWIQHVLIIHVECEVQRHQCTYFTWKEWLSLNKLDFGYSWHKDWKERENSIFFFFFLESRARGSSTKAAFSIVRNFALCMTATILNVHFIFCFH